MAQQLDVHIPENDGPGIKGTLTLDGSILELLRKQASRSRNGSYVAMAPDSSVIPGEQDDYDGTGAMYFVVIVIFLYGFSIVLMIGSNVFSKKKQVMAEIDKQTDNYLSLIHKLKDEYERDKFRKTKRELLPVIAQSPSGRELMAKRIKYLPYLTQYVPISEITDTHALANNRAQSRSPRHSIILDPVMLPQSSPLPPGYHAPRSETNTKSDSRNGSIPDNPLHVMEHHPEVHVDAEQKPFIFDDVREPSGIPSNENVDQIHPPDPQTTKIKPDTEISPVPCRQTSNDPKLTSHGPPYDDDVMSLPVRVKLHKPKSTIISIEI